MDTGHVRAAQTAVQVQGGGGRAAGPLLLGGRKEELEVGDPGRELAQINSAMGRNRSDRTNRSHRETGKPGTCLHCLIYRCS